MTDIATIKLRHKILKERGLVPPKPKRIDITKLPQPDPTIFEEIPLTAKMKYIITKYNISLKTDIFIGSINDVCSRYGWEVDRSTISRWRKYMKRFLMEAIR